MSEQLDMAIELAETVRGMKQFVMFGGVHDEQSQKEVLEQFGFDPKDRRAGLQEMAFLAYEQADAFLDLTELNAP